MKKCTKKICEGCGIEFRVDFYERNRQRFCKQSCVYKNLMTKTIDKDIVQLTQYHYIEKLKSLSDTALEVGIKYHDVRKILVLNNINIRSNAEQQKINFQIDPDRHVGSSTFIKCPICGEDFHRWDSAIHRHDDKKNFCSKECSDIDRTFRDCAVRYGHGWSEAKKKARLRDKICQICTKTPEQNGRQMDVHHICPMRFFNEDKIKAHKLSNLICLCRSCHKKVDARGRKYERKLQDSRQQSSSDRVWEKAFEKIRNQTPVFCG